MHDPIPDYPRTPHLVGFESKMDEDDKTISVGLPFKGYIQEKVDGANTGVSWDDEGPLVRNRNHMLRKSHAAKTPAKQQFTPIWNWLYENESAIREVQKRYGAPVAIYMEWLFARHSVPYDKLPSYGLGFDILDLELGKFLSPAMCLHLVEGTTINWIDTVGPVTVTEKVIRDHLGSGSKYREGPKEGIVIKQVDDIDLHVLQSMKVVRTDFQRQIGKHWNKSEIVKNVRI